MFAFSLFGLGPMELLILAIFAAVGICTIVVVVLLVARSSKPTVDPDAGLGEELEWYPPAPPAGTHRLVFEGQPVRLRLVVLAPSGRNVNLTADMAEGVLQAVMHGLGEVADLDKPRVRIWPGQLSQEGFAPKFFDNVTRAEPTGKPSPWILVAGPAKAGQRTVLVGLALQSAEPTSRGNVRMDVDKWNDKLRVQIV